MRASDLTKHPVLDVSTATTVGSIQDVVVDPTERQILGFVLGKTAGKATWLEWSHLKALGTDAATIDGTDALAAAPEQGPPALRKGNVVGGRVLTDQGLELGKLADVEFDADSGAVTALHLDRGGVVPGDALRGIGTYATMVRHPPDDV